MQVYLIARYNMVDSTIIEILSVHRSKLDAEHSAHVLNYKEKDSDIEYYVIEKELI